LKRADFWLGVLFAVIDLGLLSRRNILVKKILPWIGKHEDKEAIKRFRSL